MKTYIRTNGRLIVQVLDFRDERFSEIVENINLLGFIEVELTDEIVDAIAAGTKLDYVDGRIETHSPTAEELIETFTVTRNRIITAIEAHDKSGAVNGFSIAVPGAEPVTMWLDRETRAGLERAIATDRALGREMTVIWYEGPPPVRFELPIALAEGLLLRLEAYDYTAGYPLRPEFDLQIPEAE
jgi:hypothetical protein